MKFHGLNLSLEDDLEVAFTHVEEEPLYNELKKIDVLGFSSSPHPSSNAAHLLRADGSLRFKTFLKKGMARFVRDDCGHSQISTRKGRRCMSHFKAHLNDGYLLCFRLRPESINTSNKTRWFLRRSCKKEAKGTVAIAIKPYVSDEFCRKTT